MYKKDGKEEESLFFLLNKKREAFLRCLYHGLILLNLKIKCGSELIKLALKELKELSFLYDIFLEKREFSFFIRSFTIYSSSVAGENDYRKMILDDLLEKLLLKEKITKIKKTIVKQDFLTTLNFIEEREKESIKVLNDLAFFKN